MASDAPNSLGWLSGLVSAVIPWFIVVTIGRDAWYSKLRYSMQYSVSYEKVTKENEPHDCDCLRAPIGDKVCHFEIRVGKVLSARDDYGKPIVSYDDGKTWIPDGDAARPIYREAPKSMPEVSSVYLTWEKVENQ